MPRSAAVWTGPADRTMRARKRTRCQCCGFWITPGQMIARLRGRGPWVHVDCALTR